MRKSAKKTTNTGLDDSGNSSFQKRNSR